MNPFHQNIRGLYGPRGEQWLQDLPQIVSVLTSLWQLTDLKVLPHLSYHYVLSGQQNGHPIVLKIGIDAEVFAQETLALQAFQGYGCVKLLDQNKTYGALLLERAIPGQSLTAFFHERDQEAVEISCYVMRQLHQAPIQGFSSFPKIEDWLAALDRDWDISQNLIEKARKLRDSLLKAAAPSVLLHGDLHHNNILSQGSQWVVIDPKGILGEPAYEVAAFIRNPIPQLLEIENADKILSQRIVDFAKNLNLDEQRIHDWCFVQAVLAWVWAIEDGEDVAYFKKICEIFNEK